VGASLRKDRVRLSATRDAAAGHLEIAEAVTAALETLSADLFARVTEAIETQLTAAVQDVLGQPLRVRAKREGVKRGVAALRFVIERDGEEEDILRGQGGSVANVLSVSLRLLAIKTLNADEHRPFLVLDEQDCWLRPDLIDRFARLISDAGRVLGVQTLVISHHQRSAFERYADRIYQFVPSPSGVQVRDVTPKPHSADGE
jgi:hypothetical protein